MDLSEYKEEKITLEDKKIPHKAYYIYIGLVGCAMILLCVIFVFLPRSTYSELEKRDLATFPEVSDYNGRIGDYTAAVSHWFSDSEPFRDKFIQVSQVRQPAFSRLHSLDI